MTMAWALDRVMPCGGGLRVASSREGGTVRILVAYASRKGNTRLVAERIAAALRQRADVELIDVENAPRGLPDAELIVVGGPTEGHGVTHPMVQFFTNLGAGALAGRAAAAFDTRIDWPRLLSGSAAVGIANRLREAGAEVIAPPESFIVNAVPELLPGELERVDPWALSILEKAEESLVAAAR
jgi:flavodoxin